MGTITDKLNYLISTKEGIRQELNRAYETEEISTSDTFNSYIQKLEEHPFYLKGLIEGTIESIKLSNVTRISNSAFGGCTRLTEVSIPKATSIGDYAFQSCSSLTEITEVSFPEVTKIGQYAFQGCNSLTKVSFPNITSISDRAFQNCSSLTEVSIPKAREIGGYAFQGCNGLTKVSFPEATRITYDAFESCTGLTEVSFPKATSIGQSAFQNCSNLISALFPKVTFLGDNTFRNCSSLISASFPLVETMQDYAFYQCSSLTSVSFPVATRIYEYTFYECSKLTEASFPSATSIGKNAFYNCKSLTTIYVGTNTSTVCTLSSTSAFSKCTNLTNIYVPESLVDSYKSATNWSYYADKIKVDIQPVECISLSITADDVAIGNATSTTVHYTAKCTYTKEGILQEGTMVFTGEATSDSFEQNTSTTDTVQRTVSFTFFGKTATTTITQGVWVNQGILVTTEGISDYGWVIADSKYNVDGYDVYMSNNKGVDSSQAVMKLECTGYTDLTLYIRSYAESYPDYTIASNANASTYPTAYNSSDTKAHTRANQSSGTTLSDYTAVTYTGLSGNDIIYIVFRKDSSVANGDDRGYVLIPKV